MKKKFPKNWSDEEGEEETLDEGETYLTENDTKEIENYIKELGIDKFDAETFVVPEKESKKVKVKKSKEPVSANLVTLGNQSAKSAEPSLKVHPKKLDKQTEFKIPAKTTTLQNQKQEVNLNQAPANKKIVFNAEGATSKKAINNGEIAKVNRNTSKSTNQDQSKGVNETNNAKTTIATPQQQQNKKIVFDAEYLEESRKKNAAINEATKGQESSSSGEPWYKLLIRPDAPWYHQGKKLKPVDKTPSPEEIRKCEIEGQKYLEEDTANYIKVRSVGVDKSETRWLQTVLKSGTFADKITAHTLLLQESPAHNLASLKFLISLLDVKGRRECLASLDSLLGAFTSGKILDPNAKLVPISKQPITALSQVTQRERKELLALWTYQNQLKEHYNQFVLALDGLLKDAVEATRRKGISAIATMLAYSPEQEQGLLTRLINKIGDPTRAVATTSVGQLERLLQKHSNMKSVVVAEVERLLYRPNINVKAQYYALCFLSQILLDEDDTSLAMKLIVIYISFFKACVKKGEVDSKLMAALLTGLRRAFPYAKFAPGTSGPLNTHVDTLFKLVHMVKFALAVQVLYILDQVAGIDPSNADRFYSVLFRKLYDFDIIHTTKHSMFLNLLFRALKRDDSLPRLRSFVKRVLQVCLSSPPQLTCGLLYLVSELLKGRPEVRILNQEIPTCTVTIEDDDDEEEHFKDVDECQADSGKDQIGKEDGSKQASTWVHRNNMHAKSKARTGYDPLARNPIYGRAEQSGGYWEMNLLAAHHHPSVALFAKTIIEGKPIEYTGDPLQDFTLIRFLDRFVFRNPKKVQLTGPAQRRVLGKRNNYTPSGIRALAVDSNDFLRQPKRSVPADEMFLYDYFKQRAITVGTKLDKEKKKDQDDEDDSDVDSVASEEFEEYLMKGAVLDFSADMKAKPKADKKKKAKADESDEEDGDGATSDVDDAEADSDEDFDDDEEFQNAFKDFDDMLDDTEPAGNIDESSDEGDSDEDLEQADLGSSDEEGIADGVKEEDIEFSDEEEEDLPAPKSKGRKRAKDDDIDDLDFALDAESDGKKKKKMRDMFDTNGTDFVAAEDFAAMLESHSAGPKTVGTSEDLSNKDKASAKQLHWEMARDSWIKGYNRPKRDGKKGFKPGKKGFKPKGGEGFKKKGVKRGGKR